MKQMKKLYAMCAALIALAVMISGCGGGGGGSSAGASGNTLSPSGSANVNTTINFRQSEAMRVAAQTIPDTVDTGETETLYQGCGDFSTWHDAAYNSAADSAEVPVYVYVTENAQYLYGIPYVYSSDQSSYASSTTSVDSYSYGPVASACTAAVRSAGAQRFLLRDTGVFVIDNVVAGANHLVEALAFTGPGSVVYVAAVVPYVDEGYYSYTYVSPETTLSAAAAIKYAAVNNIDLSEVPDTVLYALDTVVYELFPDGFSFGSAVTPTGFSTPVTFDSFQNFSMGFATGTTTWDEYLITQAELLDLEDPYVIEYEPAAGAIDVANDGTAFKLVFSETMDATVQPDTLNLVLTDANSNNLTITEAMGTSTWGTTYQADDTLIFTLDDNATLSSNGFAYLQPGTSYTLSSITIPTNIQDLDGNLVDGTEASLLLEGTYFTTAGTSATTPQVTSFEPADGATAVPYDSTVFQINFDQTMDTSATPTGFSVTIQNMSTSGTIVIDDSNASSYGTLAWANAGTSLQFILQPNTVLTTNSLSTLQANTTYSIISYTPPTNIQSASLVPLDTATLPPSGSFTTAVAP